MEACFLGASSIANYARYQENCSQVTALNRNHAMRAESEWELEAAFLDMESSGNEKSTLLAPRCVIIFNLL